MDATSSSPVTIVTFADRPDLAGGFWALTDLWPRFMLEDPIADLYFSRLGAYPDFVFAALDEDERVVARALCVPFAMGGEHRRPDLPANGWDGVVRWAWLDSLSGREPSHVSALEITVLPDARGTGLAVRMIEAMKHAARGIGAAALFAPVRPSRKHEEPRTPIGEYAFRTRDDGLPADPWLRLHVRAGGRILRVCPTSMTVAGTLDQWRAWTGLTLDVSGDVEVPGALVPVHVDLDQDRAVYVEPNVWVRHDL